MADVITYARPSSPAVSFYCEYEWVQHSAATANYSWVRVRLRAVNMGNSTTAYGNSGQQHWWDNRGNSGSHGPVSPFIPSGYAYGAQRWRDEWNYDVYHDANGNGQMQFGMQVEMPDNTSVFSAVSAVYDLPRIPLVPYTPGQPNAGTITTNSVALSWANGARGHADTDQVLLRRFDGATTTGAYGDFILGAGVASYTNTGLPRGTTYTYVVYNHNSDGYSSPSAGRTVTTLHTVPDKPPTPTAGTITKDSIVVGAANPTYVGAAATSREVQLSTDNTFATVVATDTVLATGNRTFSSLTRYTQYYVRQRITNAIGVSEWSDILAVRTLADVPTAPTSYNATDIAATTAYSSQPVVSDNGNAPLNDVRWQIATTQNTGAAVVTLGRFGYPFLSGLTANTLYWYRLAVANVQGWSGYGPWVSFTTKSNVPVPVGSAAAVQTGNTTGNATWTAPSNLNGSVLSGYTIRIAPNRDFGSGAQTYTVGSGVLSKAFDGLQPGTQYFVQIWSNTNNGFGSYSQILTFTTTGTAPGATPFWVRVSGVWKPGVVWVRVGGVWKQGTPWVRVAGVWKKL